MEESKNLTLHVDIFSDKIDFSCLTKKCHKTTYGVGEAWYTEDLNHPNSLLSMPKARSK